MRSRTKRWPRSIGWWRAIRNSHYIDEAQFRRGELLFAMKSYAGAQAAYEAVIKIGGTSGVL